MTWGQTVSRFFLGKMNEKIMSKSQTIVILLICMCVLVTASFIASIVASRSYTKSEKLSYSNEHSSMMVPHEKLIKIGEQYYIPVSICK